MTYFEYAVDCPTCGSMAGSPCTNPTGTGRKSVPWTHKARGDAWRDLGEERSAVVESAHWAEHGPLSGVPGQIMRLLASPDGKTRGYGYGPGWSIIFSHEHGSLSVEPGEWVHKHEDGSFSVSTHNSTEQK